MNKEQFDRCWPKDCSQDWDHNMQTAQIPTLSDQQQLEVAVVTFTFQDNKVHQQHGLDAKSESTYGKDQLWLKAAQIPNIFCLSFSHTDGFEEVAWAQPLAEAVHLTALTKILMHVHAILKHGHGQMPPFPPALQKVCKRNCFPETNNLGWSV